MKNELPVSIATNVMVSGRKSVLTLLMRLLWVVALLLPAFGAQAGVVLTPLYSFQAASSYDGANPYAGLVQGMDGFLYGTTTAGGMYGDPGYGTVFKINTTGVYTNLYSFNGTNYGAYPFAGLVQGSDGFLYGTTLDGGTYGYGTVFKISTNGMLTSLHSFTGNNDGGAPFAGLVQGSDGLFYGTTGGGGANGHGAVFKISSAGALTSLYSFTGTNDGSYPEGGLVRGSDGYFYGMTESGGTNGYGNVFKISTNGALTNLHSFAGPHNIANPFGGLVQGSDGYIYGLRPTDGNYGTVFKISTNGAYTCLYSFTGFDDGTYDGAYPEGTLVQGGGGYFFGTTESGGGCFKGTVFIISTNGAYTSLYSFSDYFYFDDGGYPYAGLVQGSDGNLYGTTSGGGQGVEGTVFQLSFTVPTVPQVTTVSLPNGTNDVAYSQQLLALYGQPPYSWSIVSGSLPSGLTLATNGIISGTTMTNGNFNFTVQVTDALSATATQSLTLTVIPLQVTIFALPNGTNGWAYSQQLLALYGQPPYSWSIVSGSLPSGLTLAANGLISGTPTNDGMFNFIVKATDELSLTATKPLTLTVGSPPSSAVIQPMNYSVPVGTNVSFTVSVAGTGPFSYQWQLNGTNLPNGIIFTVAGNGTNGFSGDGGAATNAELELYLPDGVAVDATGNLFIADSYNNVIRKVGTNGVITTVAGNGYAAGTGDGGYSGDGGAATNAELYLPSGVVVDATGNLFIADSYNNVIRKVETNGIITTVAGNGYTDQYGDGGYSGDDGAATNAELNHPYGVAVDTTGNLFIADYLNDRIREVGTDGIITTVAGNWIGGYSGDGGVATDAELSLPNGVVVDATGNLFIADERNNRIRKVGANGIITTVAGNGYTSDQYGDGGYSGDGGAATNAELWCPVGVAMDATANLFIADEDNSRIRKVGANGIITTVVGNGTPGFFGDGGVATNAELRFPFGVAVDTTGNLLIADYENERIRKVVFSGPTLVLNDVGVGNEGAYDVVVSSPYGSVTSSVATLIITVLQVTTVALPNGTNGEAYSQPLSALYGQLPYSWSLISGSLPSGLNLATDGVISGKPTTNGTFNFTVQVKDVLSATATQALALMINLLDTNPPVLKITSPTSGQRWSNAVFTVTGTATDNVAVASVFCSLNSTGWSNVVTGNGWTNWTAAVLLMPGTNTIAAYAMDTSGNFSTTNQVSFDFVATNQLQIRTIGLGAISPNYSNAWLEIGRNYSITSAPASGFVFTNWVTSTNWIGGTTISTTNLQFTMQSNLTLQVNFVDVAKPSVSITNLVAGQRVSNAVFTVKGTASDNWQVSNVVCQINGGSWNLATNINNWTNWAAGVTLTPGTNIVQAFAVDTSGNVSTTNSVSFQFVVTNQLQIQAIGLGTVSPNYSNAWLNIGQNYSITSAPASGFVFTNWMVSTNWIGGTTTTKTNLMFMMASNLTLQVGFAETSRPTLTITAPTAGQHMTNALATVVGTASDDWKIGAVWYQLTNKLLSGGTWSLAASTNNYTNWTTTVTLAAGTNTVKAYAVNLGGNYSTTSSVSVLSSNTFLLQLNFGLNPPLTSTGLNFTLQISSNLNGHLQVSTNLTSWLPFTNFVGTNTTINFHDPAATNSKSRFYRAVIP